MLQVSSFLKLINVEKFKKKKSRRSLQIVEIFKISQTFEVESSKITKN